MSARINPTIDIQIYRYGQPGPRNGLYVGATQYLPRGVRREDYAVRGYFDVWLPLLAPSRELIAALRQDQLTFPRFARQYRAEMRRPGARQTIRLLAATARCQPVHLGCFCADVSLCHRSLLRDLVIAAAAELPVRPENSREYFSPACSMPEIED